MENLRGRTILAVIGLIICVIWVAPNVINTEKIPWPTNKKLNYGLDIQGGLHLVMGADVAGVVREGAQRLSTSLKAEFERDAIAVKNISLSKPEEGEFVVEAEDAAAKAKVMAHVEKMYGSTLQQMSDSGNSVTFRYYDSYLLDFKQKVIQQAIETIRNRIDEFGVAEPSIAQQGDDRILVQLPGMADAERAKQLINTAAKLDFQIVEEEPKQEQIAVWVKEAETAGNYNVTTLKYTDYVNRVNKDLASKLPEKTMVLFEKSAGAATMEVDKIPYLLRTDTNLGGDSITDAFVTFDPQYGTPQVALRFNAVGANAFKILTGTNKNRRMAIVLDRVVKSAPVIQNEIPNGEAVITLGTGRGGEAIMNEAKMISTALRAGALPAALEQLEERRVGPSLGADSIRQAQRGSYVGALLIFAFILFRYRTMGLISNFGLALNVFTTISLLTSLGATLTLPGIAGIALTVGFAVDANVQINERMREEVRKGSSITFAIKEGYAKAMSAILDSNITVASTALVLYYFGTGPIRGFAVTLLIGIVATLFANVFLTKVFVDTLVHKFGVKKISI